jgi:hypothetical protein
VHASTSDIQKPKDSRMNGWPFTFLPLTNLVSVMDSTKRMGAVGLKDVNIDTEDEVASNKDEKGDDLGTYVSEVDWQRDLVPAVAE